MDWYRILERGGIPDSPGRKDAVLSAVQLSKAKAKRKALAQAQKATRPGRSQGVKRRPD